MQYFRAPLSAADARGGPDIATPACRARLNVLRAAFAVLALAGLAGCASLSNTGVDTVRLLASGGPVIAPDPQAVAASPYARMQIEGAGLRAVAVLGNDDAGLESWYGDARRVVFMRGGQLAATAGLAVNADDICIEGDNPFLHLAQVGREPVPVARRYDWRSGYRYGVQVSGSLSRRGHESVEILGTSRDLVRYEEILRGPGVRASNEYWADPQTGFIWKSRQLVAPGTMLELVVLKPYLPGGS